MLPLHHIAFSNIKPQPNNVRGQLSGSQKEKSEIKVEIISDLIPVMLVNSAIGRKAWHKEQAFQLRGECYLDRWVRSDSRPFLVIVRQ